MPSPKINPRSIYTLLEKEAAENPTLKQVIDRFKGTDYQELAKQSPVSVKRWVDTLKSDVAEGRPLSEILIKAKDTITNPGGVPRSQALVPKGPADLVPVTKGSADLVPKVDPNLVPAVRGPTDLVPVPKGPTDLVPVIRSSAGPEATPVKSQKLFPTNDGSVIELGAGERGIVPVERKPVFGEPPEGGTSDYPYWKPGTSSIEGGEGYRVSEQSLPTLGDRVKTGAKVLGTTAAVGAGASALSGDQPVSASEGEVPLPSRESTPSQQSSPPDVSSPFSGQGPLRSLVNRPETAAADKTKDTPPPPPPPAEAEKGGGGGGNLEARIRAANASSAKQQATIDTARTKALKDIHDEAKSSKGEADTKLSGEISRLDNLRESIQQDAKDNRDRAAWAQVGETLGQAFAKIGAGAQGMRTGLDTTTGLKFDKHDWNQEYADILSNLKEGLHDIQFQSSLAERNRDRMLRDVERIEALKSAETEHGFGKQERQEEQSLANRTGAITHEWSSAEQAARDAARQQAAEASQGRLFEQQSKLIADKETAQERKEEAKQSLKNRTEFNQALNSLPVFAQQMNSGRASPDMVKSYEDSVKKVASGMSVADGMRFQEALEGKGWFGKSWLPGNKIDVEGLRDVLRSVRPKAVRPSSTEPAPAPKIQPGQRVEYPKGSGKWYNVDSKGDMTPA